MLAALSGMMPGMPGAETLLALVRRTGGGIGSAHRLGGQPTRLQLLHQRHACIVGQALRIVCEVFSHVLQVFIAKLSVHASQPLAFAFHGAHLLASQRTCPERLDADCAQRSPGLIPLSVMASSIRTGFLVAPAFLLLAAGCKSAPPVPEAKPIDTVAQTESQFAGLSDQSLVHANQRDGVGLGLRVDGTSFKAGAPIPLHIVIEDIGAGQSIASGLCSGASLEYAAVDGRGGSRREFTDSKCIEQVPNPDETPLTKGKLTVFSRTQEDAAHMTIPPGTYDLTIDWKALPVGGRAIVAPTPYTTLTSNPVRITVTP